MYKVPRNMQAQRERVEAKLFYLNLGSRWGGWSVRPLYPGKEDGYPLCVGPEPACTGVDPYRGANLEPSTHF